MILIINSDLSSHGITFWVCNEVHCVLFEVGSDYVCVTYHNFVRHRAKYIVDKISTRYDYDQSDLCHFTFLWW